jgi:hypothetical protein
MVEIRAIRWLLAALALLWVAAPAHAVYGVPDNVRGATLIVPYFSVGTAGSGSTFDTLFVVVNHDNSAHRVHVHVWDQDGRPIFYKNHTISAFATYSQSMRDLLATATSSQRRFLVVGSGASQRYRGFVTIDHVSASTSLNPTQDGYPFQDLNILSGQFYLARLSEGSATGLDMLVLESVPASASAWLRGFYRDDDSREEIDADARACAYHLARGLACVPGSGILAEPDDDDVMDSLWFRSFGSASPTLNGSSTFVTFAWRPGHEGGPSDLCAGAGCETSYLYRRWDEAGAIVISDHVALTHVVNLITTEAPLTSGFAGIYDVPVDNLQLYHFAINQASPAGHPELSFDVAFPGFYTH